jgi:hypothetical protein
MADDCPVLGTIILFENENSKNLTLAGENMKKTMFAARIGGESDDCGSLLPAKLS